MILDLKEVTTILLELAQELDYGISILLDLELKLKW